MKLKEDYQIRIPIASKDRFRRLKWSYQVDANTDLADWEFFDVLLEVYENRKR